MHKWLPCLILFLSLSNGPLAQGPVPPEEPVSEAPHEVDPDQDTNLEAFVDGIVASHMESDRLAGATVAVVHNGEVELIKGYGVRDGEGTSVDGEQTLFRIASISKTFIWVALMQLEEQGEISLDDPANQHLPEALQLPPGLDGEPLLVRHLMTHSAGFEDSALGHLLERDKGNLEPLNDYLARVRPTLVREPDELATYSNYASALAGALVAHVSGQSFHDYVESHIYAPLGMEQATFREIYDPDAVHKGMPAPVSETLAEDFSEGFREQQGLLEPAYFEYLIHTAPSGGMSASAGAMSRFMQALLNDGELDGERILAANTAQRMRQTLFSNAEGMNGLAHGFIEYRFPGELRGYGHGGALVHFFSGMVLVPELDLGIFVSTNTAGGRGFSQALPKHLVARFADKDDTETEAADAEAGASLDAYAGTYRNTRRSYTTAEKFTALDSLMEVSVHEDEELVTRMNGVTRRWQPVAEGEHLFQRVDGAERLAFGEDSRGEIHRVYHPSGINAGERIGFFQGANWLFIIMGVTGLTAIWQMGAFWQRRRAGVTQSRSEAWAGVLMLFWSLAWLISLLLAWQAISGIQSAGAENLFNWPPAWLQGWVLSNNLAAVLSVAAIAGLFPLWRHHSWSLRQRLYQLLAVLAGLALVFTLNDWQLIGWRF
ncbi:CubicO group peptidase (beta-lactamase class C family) [Natronospira proteinivora]|uniref:CubicO group peptidase (Beta-lactamase class C family) n=1 Tax=Natronospira proteinivora TaxID=1807133 RepID=A0ABT1G8K4_9GAMM|nr:serine hydrolase domain-containing protein [Natronospira proteinivora]MCP1727640.1 CubicO group peptidase (beta-lactamase class C family) [Natronospira proteinivora]